MDLKFVIALHCPQIGIDFRSQKKIEITLLPLGEYIWIAADDTTK